MKRAKLFSKVAGAGLFKTRYGWFDCFHCCKLLDNSNFSYAGNVIFFQTSICPLHIFDRGSEFILLMEPFCKSKTNYMFRANLLIRCCLSTKSKTDSVCVPAPKFERT